MGQIRVKNRNSLAQHIHPCYPEGLIPLPVVCSSCSDVVKNQAGKLALLFLIPFMLFINSLLYSMGEPEIHLPVPADALIVGEVDCQVVLDTDIGLTIATILSTGEITEHISGRDTLDVRLAALWGIKSIHIDRIIWCILSLDPDVPSHEYGAVISLKTITPQEILGILTVRLSLKKSSFGHVAYYTGYYRDTPLCLGFHEKKIVVTSSREGMTKMIDAVQGKNDLTGNTRLFRILKQYRKTPFYCTGLVTEELEEMIPHPFNKVKYFVLSVNPADRLSIRIMTKADNPDMAQKIVTMAHGYMQLMTSLIMAEDKEGGRIAGELMGRITMEAKGSDVIIQSVYTKEDIQKAAGLFFLFSSP